ncbi:hypothetical protein HWN40_04725 [Methanolobus zinderi]|jgi:dolichol kinase|uniref:Phosphatidate cytidylyltransferase n=1 Tax=Methanolobus zinderi TaxID=536044 RepID=A0A7D5I4H5_9EURY|nr:diacylglycerol/polyprenol kinase family protein [Methanolobus zinderi]KXS43861.1 MAG: hypothetical protein AWU59_859 [Methanolobus sp. T82-4]QLC49601.1 hypothetical protein HWN40_04725 [Methanolobus zinderi]
MDDKEAFLTGEFLRQLIHILTGIVFILIISFSGDNAALVFFVILLALTLFSILVTGLDDTEKSPRLVRKLERSKKQKIKFQGTILLLSGVFVTLILFPVEIVYASVAIVTFGDSIATIVGTSIGRHKLPYSDKKSLEGTFSGLIVAFLVAMLFVTPFQAFIGSLGGMFMESAISMRTIKRANIMSVIRFFINDNFLIPIFSSALMFYAVI